MAQLDRCDCDCRYKRLNWQVSIVNTIVLASRDRMPRPWGFEDKVMYWSAEHVSARDRSLPDQFPGDIHGKPELGILH